MKQRNPRAQALAQEAMIMALAWKDATNGGLTIAMRNQFLPLIERLRTGPEEDKALISDVAALYDAYSNKVPKT